MAEAVASTKRFISVCVYISIRRYVGLDGRVAELMVHHAALLCYHLPWEARNEVAKWSLHEIAECVSALCVLDSVSGVARGLHHQSNHCLNPLNRLIENSAIILQLAKALNADGDIIDSERLKGVQKVMQLARDLRLLVSDMDH